MALIRPYYTIGNAFIKPYYAVGNAWVGTFRFSEKYNGKIRKASGSITGAQGDLKGSRENDTSFFNEKNHTNAKNVLQLVSGGFGNCKMFKKCAVPVNEAL